MSEPVTIGGQTFINDPDKGWIDRKTKVPADKALVKLLTTLDLKPVEPKLKVKIDRKVEPVSIAGQKYLYDSNSKLWVDEKNKQPAPPSLQATLNAAIKLSAIETVFGVETHQQVEKAFGTLGQVAKGKVKTKRPKTTLVDQNKKQTPIRSNKKSGNLSSINPIIVRMISILSSIDGVLKQKLEQKKLLDRQNSEQEDENNIEAGDQLKDLKELEMQEEKEHAKRVSLGNAALLGGGAYLLAKQFDPIMDALVSVGNVVYDMAKATFDIAKSLNDWIGWFNNAPDPTPPSETPPKVEDKPKNPPAPTATEKKEEPPKLAPAGDAKPEPVKPVNKTPAAEKKEEPPKSAPAGDAKPEPVKPVNKTPTATEKKEEPPKSAPADDAKPEPVKPVNKTPAAEKKEEPGFFRRAWEKIKQVVTGDEPKQDTRKAEPRKQVEPQRPTKVNPIDAMRINSRQGWRRDPFGSGKKQYHTGVDVAVPYGTPVKAAAAGKVIRAGWQYRGRGYGGYGNAIIVKHDDGTQALYGHLSAINTKVGDTVVPGQIIGKVGSTGGRSTGPHLHFQINKAGATHHKEGLMNTEAWLSGAKNGETVEAARSDTVSSTVATAVDTTKKIVLPTLEQRSAFSDVNVAALNKVVTADSITKINRAEIEKTGDRVDAVQPYVPPPPPPPSMPNLNASRPELGIKTPAIPEDKRILVDYLNYMHVLPVQKTDTLIL